ncbi:hypothetical protein L210DRAFT_3761411 [Boletus edulis BED1]|uniref:RRM domain-containing protein n=1 Tax=Boletus edulis BED1 TaxID=1328754 RepID=A0AAD4BSI4_BOLED|nr:hypothetical protein L210DRAFT_3761411 [Boletus edulis BED1]
MLPPGMGTCYIANIPYEVTAEQLKDAFSDLGKVMSVRLLTSGEGRSRGIGFVQFESVEDADAQKPGNVQRRVEPSDTLMMPEFQGTSEAEVQSMFGSYADDILAARFDKKEPSRNAFIQFRDVNIAKEAMEAFRNQNQDIQINYPQPTLLSAQQCILLVEQTKVRYPHSDPFLKTLVDEVNLEGEGWSTQTNHA